MTRKKRFILILPGIFTREGFVRHLRSALPNFEGEISVFRIPWIGKNSYQKSYDQLRSLISKKTDLGYAVYLFGTSAGASVARALFNDSSLRIRRLITICGPIRDAGTWIFSIGKTISPTWKTSLAVCESIPSDRNVRNIHTIIPSFDELVPIRSMEIPGANILRIPGMEHLYSITSAMSVYVGEICRLLR